MAQENESRNTNAAEEGFGPRVRDVIREQIHKREGTTERSELEDLSQQAIPFSERDMLWWLHRVDLREIGGFTRELSILLNIGTPLLQALHSIGGRTTNARLRHIIYRVGVMVENGYALWQALSYFPRLFSPLYVSSVRAGEISGNLPSVLERLADNAEQGSYLRRRLWGILAYPVLVIIVAIVVCAVLSSVILPEFQKMFADFDEDLPLLTQGIAGIITWLSAYWYWIVIGVVGVGILYKLARLLYPVRLLTDRIKTWLPIVGPLLQKFFAARFARSFCMLYQSGVSVVEALTITRGTMGNEAAALHVDRVRSSIERGGSLEASIKEGRIFPDMLTDMVSVGEEAGNLDYVLPRVADVYERETAITLDNISSIIEPLLILVIGALVLLVFAGFFLPYIDLLGAVSGAQ